MTKHYLSANEYQADIWRLAAAIRASGWRPDYLVGLWRGGAPVAISVHEFLRAAGWDVRHLPLKCWSYTGIGESSSEVAFLFEKEVFSLFKPGEKVLFLDDVFDTGRTAAAVVKRMADTGAEAKVACVYRKREMNQTAIKPDFIAKDIGGEWIVFPHEIDGLTREEIAEKDPALAELLHFPWSLPIS